jgi:2-polyprenyl-3-methyl-5-hydroxy-6-metoxy-1,4-benzoquinol methylase
MSRTYSSWGCGTGSVTKELVRLGYEVTGVDISEEMLCEAQKKAGGRKPKIDSSVQRHEKAGF